MIRVIIGEKGTGKTKTLLDSVHAAVDSEKGSVVFINNGNRHIYDLSHKIRMVDTSEFSIDTYDKFYGLLCGIVAQNFDVSYVFIDSITKIAGDTIAELEAFLDKANALCEKFSLQLAITISMSPEHAGAKVCSYVK